MKLTTNANTARPTSLTIRNVGIECPNRSVREVRKSIGVDLRPAGER